MFQLNWNLSTPPS